MESRSTLGKPATRVGFWCTMPTSLTAEVFSRSGADYVCLDYQHGLFDHTSAVHAFQGISAGSAESFARVAANEPHLIASALDAGATTVIVPLVNDAKEAEHAVRSCHYPPRGHRSYGPVRARMTRGTSDPTELSQVECLVMIETVAGLRNVDAIISTPGVDGIYVGPSDLAIAVGLTPHAPPYAPALEAAVKTIAAACDRHNKVLGIAAPDGVSAAGLLARGFNLIGISSDTAMLSQAADRAIAQARVKGSGVKVPGEPSSGY